MQRALATAALTLLCCAAGPAVDKPSPGARPVEAQEDSEEDQSPWEAERNDSEAIDLLARTMGLMETHLGINHPAVFDCIQRLGVLSQSSRGLRLLETILDKRPSDAATSLSNLAGLYMRLGSYTCSETLYERALSLREKSLGLYHPDVADALNHLAVLYMTQGTYARAQPLLERALTIRERALGPHHPDVATVLNNLAIVHGEQGNPERAEPLSMRALAIRERALGPHHPDVASSITNLASRYLARGDYARAKPLFERALTIREKALGPRDSDVASSLNNLATLYQAQGNYARAESLMERALAIWEATHGRGHPDITPSLSNLAVIYQAQGKYARAQPLLERALAIREAFFGQKHPDIAGSLNNLAVLYQHQADYARAQPMLERVLAMWEATLGPHHPHVAIALNNLGTLYQKQGDYKRAQPLYERALALREKTLGPHHSDVAEALSHLASLHHDQGDFRSAEPLSKRALAIQKAALGPQHPRFASALSNLAVLYTSQGQYARAELLLERALAIQEALGQNHPDVADVLNNLVLVHQARGNYERAEPLLERALAIYEEAFGKRHPRVANLLNSLASHYDAQGNYARAEPLHKRALSIVEDALGQDHPDVARSLNNLAVLYLRQGDDELAKPLMERALAILQKAHGRHHPRVATSLSNVAGIYQHLGEYEIAGFLFERALAIQEASLGKQHPDLATSLNNLANFYHEREDDARAKPLFERALSILEEAHGKSHPEVAAVLNNLGFFSLEQRDHARAELLFERALAIQEKALGEQHPDVASPLRGLARLRIAQQRLTEALPLFKRAFAISEMHLRQEVYGFSGARLAGVLHELRLEEERLYRLVRAHPDNTEVLHLALTAALLRKGRSAEEIANTSRIIYRGLGPEERTTFEKLRAVHTRLSNLSLAGPGKLAAEDYQQRRQEFVAEINALEESLARSSAPLRALRALPPPSEIIGGVAASLPKDSALVEFVAYRDTPVVSRPGIAAAQAPIQPRYLALVLFSDGRTQAIDLGPAAPLDDAAVRMHDVLARNSTSYLPEAQALYRLAFRPLVPLLGKVQRLFLSPDGQLSLAPFAALHDGRRFLVDAWDITYLTSGKELLPRPADIPTAHSVVVLADPDFSSPLAEPVADQASNERSAVERYVSSLSSGFDRPFEPLPGTLKEAEAIARLFPEAQPPLLGRAATKEALLGLPTPGLLHIATHGFFLEDAAPLPGTRAKVPHLVIGAKAPKCPPEPMLCSGLVLAGAQATTAQPGSQRGGDSFVTALELSGMNLWGTQLVVLSACDTGRGNAKPGQGVDGLRRALVVAGAETLVTSLWKVKDDATHELMEAYYRNLLKGQGRTTALRQAMLVLRQKWPHPYFWAPFIAIGRDAPLQRLTPPTAESPSALPPGATAP